MLGCKYETQKNRFSFLPHRNFHGLSRRSAGEKLQNRIAVENRRGGGNCKSRGFHALVSPKCHTTGNRFATIAQQPIWRNTRVRLHLLHKPAMELIHA
jgi:hypothetical protein